ncbi:hypothetical protein QVD17_06747 [Tagetes erecta]|uniref:Uncharacterized protein n=1 Tax=Tagetes erecta TaxID=13708 RepID=A0AAD8PBI5_TARER|nr:hypothetical protein QVD17_06747 [Tagetes erecta]
MFLACKICDLYLIEIADSRIKRSICFERWKKVKWRFHLLFFQLSEYGGIQTIFSFFDGFAFSIDILGNLEP